MRFKSLVAAMAMLFVAPASAQFGGGGLGLSGILTFSDKSHNPSFRAGMVVTAVAPKSGRTLGYVANGEAIATAHVGLVFTLILDNVEMRDEGGKYVQVEVYSDVFQKGNFSILKEMDTEITGNVLAAKAKQNRLFSTAFNAGELGVGGYTVTLRIRAAKHSSGRFIVGWGKRSGEIIESSFHFAVRESAKPSSDWEMASQLAGFNILIAPPAPVAEASQMNPLIQQMQGEIERLQKALLEANAKQPEPKAELPKMKEWSVATTIKATVHDGRTDTGKQYPCDMRWVLRVADAQPTLDLRPNFGPDEKASSGYSDGQTVGAKSVVDVSVRATGDVFIVAWMRGTGPDGKPAWSNAVWVKVDSSVSTAELKFPMTVPTQKGGKKP